MPSPFLLLSARDAWPDQSYLPGPRAAAVGTLAAGPQAVLPNLVPPYGISVEHVRNRAGRKQHAPRKSAVLATDGPLATRSEGSLPALAHGDAQLADDGLGASRAQLTHDAMESHAPRECGLRGIRD